MISMKQLGNLAMVCAQRPDVRMSLSNGTVAVHVGGGPQRRTLTASWSDDATICRMIAALNFGEYAPGRHENVEVKNHSENSGP